MAGKVLRLKPLEFAHVLDVNENVTYVETGPCSIILQENQNVVFGPASYVIIPAGCCCTILHPAKLPVPAKKQAKLKFGLTEYRFQQDPFPLYPGEILIGSNGIDFSGGIKKLPVVGAGEAMKLEAMMDFDDNGVKRTAGDEWQIEGPCTYYPRPEEKRKAKVEPVLITYQQALRLRAKADLVDKDGVARVTGEEWLYRKCGSYLTGIHEEVVSLVDGRTLTLNNALHVTAEKNLVDGIGKRRLAGEVWLVTNDDSTFYIPEVGEKIVLEIQRTVLAKQQWCIVVNAYDENGRQQLGRRELRKGECSFFVKPGEKLESGIQNAYVLQNDQALILQAMETHRDSNGVFRNSGDIWMTQGPLVYIPPVEVKVNDVRKPIPLSKNEGIYVQNIKTGIVKTVMGPQSYLLNEHEKLWSKELSPDVENMLSHGGCFGEGDIRKLAYFESSIDPDNIKRNKTKVVNYRVPTNCAVQVFDHQKQSARVVFGPNLASLGPSEEFNVLSLSAGKPKKSNALKCLAIMLGPDFMSDIIEVETSDHARLKIVYAANNRFEYTIGDEASEKQLFTVPDYIGFATKNLASRIRGVVAKTSFDQFHRYSTRIIMEAVFGTDSAGGKMNDVLRFSENNMVITNIDVQNIEPVDVHMRDSLLKSVQLAIEISTQSIELSAKHEALRIEQSAKGNLERYKLDNEKAAEAERKHLYSLRAVTAAVESSGQAKAEAQAEAQKSLIEGKSAIDVAELKMKAQEIEEEMKLATLQNQRQGENAYTRTVNRLEVDKAKQLAQIETDKTSNLIQSIGKNTISNIAKKGPSSQIEMLQALGIKGTLITDGKSPVNLYQAGNGVVYPML